MSRALVALVALVARVATVDASCAPPAYACARDAPTLGASTRCHASWSCRMVCAAGAACVETLSVRAGVARVPSGEDVRFNASVERDGLGPSAFGGDASCSAVGCDAYGTRLTAQNEARTARYDGTWCETRETSERCEFKGAPRDGAWTEFTMTMKCRNKILPCDATASAEIDFMATVAKEPETPSPPMPPMPPIPPPVPPSPPSPPTPPGAFAPGGAGRRSLRLALIAALVAVVAYAVVGGAYLKAFDRGWVEGIAEPCWDREGAFCELLWCWCVPRYWRHTDEECLAAYEDRSTPAPRSSPQTTAPLLESSDSDADSA